MYAKLHGTYPCGCNLFVGRVAGFNQAIFNREKTLD